MKLGEIVPIVTLGFGLSLAAVGVTDPANAEVGDGDERAAVSVEAVSGDDGHPVPPDASDDADEDASGSTAAACEMPADWTTWRVAGDLFAVVGRDGDAFTFGRMRVDEDLPEGYPQPTPPGAIELKRYPSVRRAEVSGGGDPRVGSFRGFFPLFRHIERNGISMTAPVEMELHSVSASGSPQAVRPGEASWTMSFLYESADLGPTGVDEADPRVRIVDAEPVKVLAIGVRGWSGVERLREHLTELDAWLAENDDWRAVREPRTLGYNGPSTPASLRWAEVQVPVERIAVDDSRASDNEPSSTGEADISEDGAETSDDRRVAEE